MTNVKQDMERLCGSPDCVFAREDNELNQMELRAEAGGIVISGLSEIPDWISDTGTFYQYKLDKEGTEKFLQSLRSEQNAGIPIENVIFSKFRYECETCDLIRYLWEHNIPFDRSHYRNRLH